MKILPLSDLHLEFGGLQLPDSRPDVVVLAGDIHVGIKGVQWAKEAFPSIPVVYVPGNHEFYRHTMPDLVARMKRVAEGSQVHVLDRDSIEVAGVTFLGCTLWTDLNLYGDSFMAGLHAKEVMTDFKLIRVAPQYRRMRPSDLLLWNRASSTWLKNSLAENLGKPVVVVTHHAPSARSLELKRANDPLNPAYASDMNGLVEEGHAQYWIHGHIHKPCDYVLGSTRVICNPRGYVDSLVEGFRSELLLEVRDSTPLGAPPAPKSPTDA